MHPKDVRHWYFSDGQTWTPTTLSSEREAAAQLHRQGSKSAAAGDPPWLVSKALALASGDSDALYSELAELNKWSGPVELLNVRFGLWQKGQSTWTPLTWLCSVDGIAEAKTLVERGAGLETRDGEGRTPLMSAASHGQVACLRWLVEQGANLDMYAADEEALSSLPDASSSIVRGALQQTTSGPAGGDQPPEQTICPTQVRGGDASNDQQKLLADPDHGDQITCVDMSALPLSASDPSTSLNVAAVASSSASAPTAASASPGAGAGGQAAQWRKMVELDSEDEDVLRRQLSSHQEDDSESDNLPLSSRLAASPAAAAAALAAPASPGLVPTAAATAAPSAPSRPGVHHGSPRSNSAPISRVPPKRRLSESAAPSDAFRPRPPPSDSTSTRSTSPWGWGGEDASGGGRSHSVRPPPSQGRGPPPRHGDHGRHDGRSAPPPHHGDRAPYHGGGGGGFGAPREGVRYDVDRGRPPRLDDRERYGGGPGKGYGGGAGGGMQGGRQVDRRRGGFGRGESWDRGVRYDDRGDRRRGFHDARPPPRRR